MHRFLRRLFGLNEPARLRRRIGFVPPGKEPELVEVDSGDDELEIVSGEYVEQDPDEDDE